MKTVLLLTLSSFIAINTFAASDKAAKIIDVKVTIDGFEPKVIEVPADEKVILKVTRTTDSTCATEIVIPSLKIKKDLPKSVAVNVPIGPLKKGDVPFGCGMNLMISGVLKVK